MNTVTVPAPRHTSEITPSETRITIPAKMNVLILIFMLFWLSIWMTAGFGMIGNVLSNSFRQLSGFALIWVCFWAIGISYVVIGVLWQFAGKEIIRIAEGEIEIRYAIFGIGFSKRYTLTEAHKLRVSPNPPVSFWNSRRGQSPFGEPGIIAFDYGAKTIRFGRSLDEAEATQIVAKLSARHAGLNA